MSSMVDDAGTQNQSAVVDPDLAAKEAPIRADLEVVLADLRTDESNIRLVYTLEILTGTGCKMGDISRVASRLNCTATDVHRYLGILKHRYGAERIEAFLSLRNGKSL